MPTKRIIRRTYKHEILNSVLSEHPPELLYHYTDQKGLLGIVKSKEIWATHHQCLNDTQEFLHAKGLIRGEIKTLWTTNSDSRSLLDEMLSALDGPGNEDVNLYITSFSEDGNSLSQWRAYGGQTSGFALGFWGDRLVLPEEFTMARCVYEPSEQCKIAEAIVAEVLERALSQVPTVTLSNAKTTASVGMRFDLHRFALIFKHPEFREEREWRIVSRVLMDFAPAVPTGELEDKLDFKQGKSMLIPYRHVPLRDDRGGFPLHEVIVGPNPNREQSARSVQSLLNSQRHCTAVKVRNSEIPYRNW